MIYDKRNSVLLILEGTYPFNRGGVSTWAHTLCNKVKNTDFTLYSINAVYEDTPKFTLSDNVKKVIQVPLWTPDEPQDYTRYNEEYYKTITKRELTNDVLVERDFVPLFENLLHIIFAEDQDCEKIDSIFKAMWEFFKNYDYKKTMRNFYVWDAYRKIVSKHIKTNQDPEASLQDLTTGLRWIYRFLIPLSVNNIPKVNIAHLTLSGFPIIPALIAQYKWDTKIMLTEHGVFIRERLLAINNAGYPFFLKNLLIRFSEMVAKLTYHKAEVILSVNQFNKKWETLYGADPDKIEVVYNGIDENLFRPRPKPKHLQNTPSVVAAARIFELKDILTMIRTCKVVKQEIPEVQFLIYGDKEAVPEYTKKCEKLIEKLGVQDNFKLLGNRDDPHLIFGEGDVSILTSISEGFPYTVLESMACGVPVVATDVGGVGEAIDKGSGFICKPKDHLQLGGSLIKILKNKDLKEKMGVHARQRVLDNFTIKNFINQYQAAYKALPATKKRTTQNIQYKTA